MSLDLLVQHKFKAIALATVCVGLLLWTRRPKRLIETVTIPEEAIERTVVEKSLERIQTKKQKPGKQLPLFKQQLDQLLSQIKQGIVSGKILLLEGAPGIGKGFALSKLVMQRPISVHIKLAEHLMPLDDTQDQNQAQENGELFMNAIKEGFGLESVADEDLYDTLENILKICKQQQTCLIVVDDLQLLFRRFQPSEVYQDSPVLLQWLVQFCVQGLADLILCSSSKSILIPMQALYDQHLNFRNLESVTDQYVISYLLKSINPTLSAEKQFTKETASLFAAMFQGNMIELNRYCASDLSVQDFVSLRKREFMAELLSNIPSVPTRLMPFTPPPPPHAAFKEVILEMIMKSGKLSLMHLENERFQLVRLLIERNFLRWLHDENAETSESSTDSYVMASLEEASDPYSYLRKGDTFLVWYSRLVAEVCEEWFNNQQ